MMLAGVAHDDERQWERTAWLAANILNVSGKQVRSKVTVDKLLGRRSKNVQQFPNDPAAAFAELMRRQKVLESKKNGEE